MRNLILQKPTTMSGLAITRGRYFTSDGLPIYEEYGADLGSLYDGDFMDDAPDCVHCGKKSAWTWGFPVVVQRGRRWFATMYFNQCDRCNFRAQTIMKTSDHLGVGRDEWDIIDDATQLITDSRWDTFPKWTMEAANELARTKMDQLEDLRQELRKERKGQQCEGDEPMWLPDIPDILGVIQDKLAEIVYNGKREEGAKTIQRAWTRMRARMHKHMECPHPCGICGTIFDVGLNRRWEGVLTIDDEEAGTLHPVCYQECSLICRTCGCRQTSTHTPMDVSESPGNCYVCGADFACFAYENKRKWM